MGGMSATAGPGLLGQPLRVTLLAALLTATSLASLLTAALLATALITRELTLRVTLLGLGGALTAT